MFFGLRYAAIPVKGSILSVLGKTNLVTKLSPRLYGALMKELGFFHNVLWVYGLGFKN